MEHLIKEKRMTQKKIAEEYGIGRSTVSDYKKRFGIEAQRNGYQGQVPYGCKINRDGTLIEEGNEQKIIQLINQLTREGKSLRAICKELTDKKVLTKNGGKWHPNTITKIISRV